MTTAFYPGSFDPITNGHLDVLVQALNVAAKVIVAIGVHPGKAPLFSFDERADLIRAALEETLPERAADISVVSFDNLVVDAAREHGARLLVRGLRDGTDLDYEMQMAGMQLLPVRPRSQGICGLVQASSHHLDCLPSLTIQTSGRLSGVLDAYYAVSLTAGLA